MRKLLIILLIVLVCFLLSFVKKSINDPKYAQRKLAKIEYKLANLLEIKPQKIVISGTLDRSEIEVSALYTSPNWKSLTDKEGKFFIPDITWYPGRIYSLVFIDPENFVGTVDFLVPWNPPKSGVLDIGNISFNKIKGYNLDLLKLTINYINYDKNNEIFYNKLFFEITENKQTEQEKMLALNQYIAGLRIKRNKPKVKIKSPQELLSNPNFSYSCGEMSFAMATVLQSANYKVRLLGVMKEGENNSKHYTHELVEVFYENEWHLFDPTYGVAYLKENSTVANYRDLLKNPRLLEQHPIKVRQTTMPYLYQTRIHHIAYLR
jgi:hypothetical protein